MTYIELSQIKEKDVIYENKQGGSLADLEEEIVSRELERKIREAEAVIKLGEAMRKAHTTRQESEDKE